MRVHIIAAISENNVIGTQGKLPWRLKSDMERFRRLTRLECPALRNVAAPVRGEIHLRDPKAALVMGRVTYESLNQPLEGRMVFVVSPSHVSGDGTLATERGGAWYVSDLHSAAKHAYARDATDLFVCGGTRLYTQAMPFAHTLLMTRVHASVTGDRAFPRIVGEHWRLLEELPGEFVEADADNQFPSGFVAFQRSKKLRVAPDILLDPRRERFAVDYGYFALRGAGYTVVVRDPLGGINHEYPKMRMGEAAVVRGPYENADDAFADAAAMNFAANIPCAPNQEASKPERLQEDLRWARAQIEDLRDEAHEARCERDDAVRRAEELAGAEEQASDLEREIESLKTKCAHSHAELTSLRDELAATRARSLRRKKRNRKLRDALGDMTRQWDCARMELRELNARNERLLKEVSDLRGKLAPYMVQDLARSRHERLFAQWYSEAAHLSNPSAMIETPAAHAIRQTGVEAVPHLALALMNDTFGYAAMLMLGAILGGPEIPAEEQGRTSLMRERWLRWLLERGTLAITSEKDSGSASPAT